MASLHKIHKPLRTSKKRYVYECGGRGSGKSFAITFYCLYSTYEPGRVILFMRYTMMSASISIIPEFEAAMDREGVRKHFHISGSDIVNKATGSRIIFKGVKTSSLNQTANLKSIQGLTDVVYDEFEEHPDKESFDKLDESVRETSNTNKIILSSNALWKKSWQYKEFFLPEGLYYTMTDHIRTNYLEHNLDNLSASWLQKVDLVKQKDPEKYKRDFLGEHYDHSEFTIFKDYKIIENIPDNVEKYYIGLDFGFTDPCAAVLVGVNHDNLYLSQIIYSTGLTIDEVYKVLSGYSELTVADAANPGDIEWLKRKGMYIVKADKPQGSVYSGVMQMKTYNIHVTAKSRDLIEELDNYSWDPDKADQPIDAFNHAIDAARYVVQTKLNKKEARVIV